MSFSVKNLRRIFTCIFEKGNTVYEFIAEDNNCYPRTYKTTY